LHLWLPFPKLLKLVRQHIRHDADLETWETWGRFSKLLDLQDLASKVVTLGRTAKRSYVLDTSGCPGEPRTGTGRGE
jgi:hypothetical protein